MRSEINTLTVFRLSSFAVILFTRPSNCSLSSATFASASSLTLSSGFLFAVTLSQTSSMASLISLSDCCIHFSSFLSRCICFSMYSSRCIRFSMYSSYWLAADCVFFCNFSHLFSEAFSLTFKPSSLWFNGSPAGFASRLATRLVRFLVSWQITFIRRRTSTAGSATLKFGGWDCMDRKSTLDTSSSFGRRVFKHS